LNNFGEPYIFYFRETKFSAFVGPQNVLMCWICHTPGIWYWTFCTLTHLSLGLRLYYSAIYIYTLQASLS